MGFEAIYNWGVHHLVHDVASHPHTPTPPQVAPLVAYQEAGVWWKKNIPGGTENRVILMGFHD